MRALLREPAHRRCAMSKIDWSPPFMSGDDPRLPNMEEEEKVEEGWRDLEIDIAAVVPRHLRAAL